MKESVELLDGVMNGLEHNVSTHGVDVSYLYLDYFIVSCKNVYSVGVPLESAGVESGKRRNKLWSSEQHDVMRAYYAPYTPKLSSCELNK